MKKKLNEVRFVSCNAARFEAGLHMQFQRKEYEQVKAADPTKVKIPAELLKEWEAAVNVEVEINKQATASAHTAQLRAKDEERDDLLSYIFNLVKVQVKAPVADIRTAAHELEVVLRPYTGIQTESVEIESGHIVGLEKDLERYTAQTAKLGLTVALQQLHTVNEAYESLRTERRVDELDAKLPPTKVARAQTDDAFDRVCRYIEASYLFAKAEDQPAIARLVDMMNKIAADFRATHNAISPQNGAKDKKKPGGGDGNGKTPGKPDEKPGGSDGGGKTPGGDKGSDGKGPNGGKTPGGDKGSDRKGPNGGKTPDDGKGGKGKDDGKGKGGKKGGDDENVSPEKALITPLLPALETELNLAHDCLAYGGVTDQQDGVTIYLVVNKRTQEEMYVKVEGGKLVVVQKKG